MREREQETIPYWQLDLAIGEGQFQGQAATIRLRAHTSEEQYREDEKLIPLTTHKTGSRIYVHARPYILEPEITMTVALYPKPSPETAIGEVVASQWEGMRQREIGNAQAWYYPADRTLILWECYLFDWCRQENPSQDETLKTLWTSFERVLLEHLPRVVQIVTPSWEPIYETSLWQSFLRTQGYSPLKERAFVKEVVTA